MSFIKQNSILFITSLVLFGSNGVMANGIDLPSSQIVLFRALLGSIALIVAFLVLGGRFTIQRDRKRFLFQAMSGVSLGIAWIMLYEAFVQVGVGVSYIEYYCAPIIVMMLSPVLFKERLTAPKVIGFVLIVIGTVMLCFEMIGSGGNPVGHLYGMGSAIAQACVVIFSKLSSEGNALENVSVQMVFAFVTSLVYSVMIGSIPNIGAIDDWEPILVLGALNTGMCYFVYIFSVSKLNAQTVSALGYIEPLSAIVFSAMFLGEHLSQLQVLGAAVVVLGTCVTLALESYKGKGRRRIPEPAIVETVA